MQKYQKCTVGINFCKGVHVCESHFMQVFLRLKSKNICSIVKNKQELCIAF